MHPTLEHQIDKENLGDFKKDIESNTILVGDFNTPLSQMDISVKLNPNKISTKILWH